MSDESTSDTSTEVERIRDEAESMLGQLRQPMDWQWARFGDSETGEAYASLDAIERDMSIALRSSDRVELWGVSFDTPGDPEGGHVTVCYTGNGPTSEVHARFFAGAPAVMRGLLAALDRVTAERDAYKRAKAENDERFMTERDQARAERDALAARLPSPESVTRARLVAAEIVEVATALVASNETDWRAIANNIAAHIRDRARTHSGTHDEGGDVDEREMLWCASRVDGCTTLGELEALAREWREVAT